VKCYFNSFSKKDQKNLYNRILKVINDSNIPEHRRPKIFFYGSPVDEMLMPRFMNSFDCLVSPHRGEGWGLFLSQMMFLGKPTISTNYSGNLHFMNKKNSFLVDIDGFEPVDEEMCKINPNFEGKKWPKVDENSLIETMKYVVHNNEKAMSIGKEAFLHMKKNFSYKVVSNQIIKALKE
jgi:glycosyltransferase involved in cell wall biosynthesis